jgi:hypothetical protein
MAKGLFTMEDEATLLSIKSDALASLRKGQVIVSWSEAGTSVSKTFPGITPREAYEEAVFALRKLDPETYGFARRVVQGSLRGRRPGR